MLKKILQVFVIFSIFIIIFVIFGYFRFQKAISPVSEDKTLKSFLVLKGSSATSVGVKLEKEEFIRNNLFFKLYLKFTDKDEKIIPGNYLLSPSLNMIEVVEVLLKGPKDVWVLVPEGLRREEIVDIFIKGLSKTELDKDQFFEEFMEETKGKEGYLFPDTYLLAKEVRASSVVKKMDQIFNSQTEELKKEIVGGKTSEGLTFQEVVILASIVERETNIDKDRPLVAGILLNRLKIGMALQTDATVQYAAANSKCQKQNTTCQNWWPILSLEDLKINSVFNTYKYQGLPPSPISNPGLFSIRAVISPEKNDLIYYLHDKEGKIHTAKTFEDHSKNINNFLK